MSCHQLLLLGSSVGGKYFVLHRGLWVVKSGEIACQNAKSWCFCQTTYIIIRIGTYKVFTDIHWITAMVLCFYNCDSITL